MGTIPINILPVGSYLLTKVIQLLPESKKKKYGLPPKCRMSSRLLTADDKSDNQTAPNGDVPATSDGKNNAHSSEKQGNTEKVEVTTASATENTHYTIEPAHFSIKQIRFDTMISIQIYEKKRALRHIEALRPHVGTTIIIGRLPYIASIRVF